MTWEWLHNWWLLYGQGRQLRVLVARENSRALGILALYEDRQAILPGVRSTVLRFVGTGGDTSPDYLGPIVDEGRESEVVDALCRAVVHSPGWDALDLSDMVADAPFVSALEKACRAEKIAGGRRPAGAIPIARLPGTWEAYLAGLSREQRQTVRRKRRRIEEDAGGRLFTWSDRERLDEAFDTLAELHRARWRGRGERHSFSSPQYVSFHRQVMRALFDRGWLRLYCLEMGGAIIAMHYCYAYRGEVALFQSGFEPRHEKLRPGYVLMGYAIEQAIAEGMHVFDMLKGEYGHKDIWTNDKRPMTTWRSYRGGLLGSILRLRREVLKPIRDRGLRRVQGLLLPRRRTRGSVGT